MIYDVFWWWVLMIFWKIIIFMISAGRRSDMMIQNHDFHDHSKCSPGGECFAPPPSTRGSAPSSRWIKVILHMIMWRIFWFGDVSGPPKTLLGPMSARWRAMDSPHGSKNWLQRAILYRHKEFLFSREDWSFKFCETICSFLSVFLDFL